MPFALPDAGAGTARQGRSGVVPKGIMARRSTSGETYDNPRAQLSCLAEQTRLELDRHDASQARQRLSEFKHIADTAGVSSFKPIGEALELRLRMTDEEVLDPAFGNEIEALFGDLDPDSLRIAELAAELGQGLFDQGK